MPRPKAVDTVIRPVDLHLAFEEARIHVLAPPEEVEAACAQINAGLTSLVVRRNNQMERLQDIRSALLRVADSDFRPIAAFTGYLAANPNRQADRWSLSSDAPQLDDPVVLALLDAARSRPHFVAAGDTPGDDAPLEEIIAWSARMAAKVRNRAQL